ncbi:uncharacterized protein [Elaeis guineensis]|uniref:Uncharacterized protein LOC105048123 isoform X2 n=1 Tax=Elaeis guineensis var. tenera TaxID=51953 RepID=A0A6I9RFE1_ELAGV|nr:uncharacterized protein LOC105048123 isoform X2 [Elaeis guineensis]
MDPALERRYREEVLHLHSLWHRGPPRNPNPNPTLRPDTSTAFKKEAKNKKKSNSKGKKKHRRQRQQQQGSAAASDQPPAKEVEWPCGPTPEKNDASATWADFVPTPAAPQTRPPFSAEEQARAVAHRAQQRGLKACKDFFAKKDGSDDGEEEEEDSTAEEEEAGEGDFKFFLELFEGDGELREYYEKNWEKGDFKCLVCGAIGEKKWKRFGECVGLIQHSNSISKTRRREAHRAFARAVCRVLGWDINRLPSIVLDSGKSLGQSLAKAANPQEDMPKEDLSAEVEKISNEVAADAGTDKVDLMDCAAKEIEALPGNEGEIDEKENDEEPMDCIETKRITELPNEDMPKEDLSAEVEEISHEVAADAGTDKVDLMDCAAKEIEALPGENLQKEGEIDEKENDEEPMDCIETKRITELPNEDVIEQKEKLPREIDNHGETNDGTQ